MRNVIVREARMSDLVVLLEFEQAVIESERPFDSTIKRGPTSYYDIRELIQSPDIRLVVAELDGRLIASGYARIEKAKPYYEHSHQSYLGFMYVVPEYRGKGLNRLIIDSLQDWSLRQGVNEIVLEVFSDNAPAIRAYEKAGFAANLITMRARIDQL